MKAENMVTIKAEGLSPDEKKELHAIVRKIARKRRKGMKTPLMYELNFDGTRFMPRSAYLNEAQRDS